MSIESRLSEYGRRTLDWQPAIYGEETNIRDEKKVDRWGEREPTPEDE